MFQMMLEKQIRSMRIDWRFLLVCAVFSVGLFLCLQIVPNELRLIVLLIPLSVGVTAASTYVMINFSAP